MELYGERPQSTTSSVSPKVEVEEPSLDGDRRTIQQRKVAFPWLSSGKSVEEDTPISEPSSLPNHSSLPSISDLPPTPLERADDDLLSLSDKHLTHSVDHEALANDGALLGKNWSWLDLELDELAKLGIVVPKLWTGKTRGWGGDHFEIARHLPRKDFEYLVERPLTLHIEELNAYVVHAGMCMFSYLRCIELD